MRVVALILLHTCLLIARSMANTPAEDMHLTSSSKSKLTAASAALMVDLIANAGEKAAATKAEEATTKAAREATKVEKEATKAAVKEKEDALKA